MLRTAADSEDVERIANFNGAIHGPGLAALTRSQAEHLPGMELADLFFVADNASGAVVSALCLAPWTIQVGPAQLPVGEMSLVGTAESYRRRGLVRAQVQQFMRRLAARGCLLSLIQGIPYYYRQFGYTYALPLEGGWIVNPRELPPIVREGTPIALPRWRTFHCLPGFMARPQTTWPFTPCARRPTGAILLGPLLETELSCTFWLQYDCRPTTRRLSAPARSTTSAKNWL